MMTDDRIDVRKQLKVLTLTFGVLFLAAFFAMVAAGRGYDTGLVGVGLCIVLSSTMVGGLIGFLFSVPRVFSRPEAAPANGQGVATEAGRRLLQTNTNLERISDWLTTMLVGVGLSQLGNINEGLLGFRRYIAEYAFATPAQTNALAVISPLLLLFGLVGGFMAMYVYTRVVLATVLNSIEDVISGLNEGTQNAVATVAREAQAEGAVSAAVAAAADPATPVTAQGSIDLMYDLLYQADGYKRVIEVGEKLTGTPATDDARYWFYLAAAYGQGLSDATERDDSGQAATMRSKALAAAENAIRISPGYRSRLWSISDPKSVDNDLAPLREDKDFLYLVKR